MSYDNVVVWPQPDLRLPVPCAPEAKKNARKLSMHFPPAQRAEVERSYLQQLEKKMGWAPRDMAGGLAAFLVGNYMVLHDREVSDEAFAAVAAQLAVARMVHQKSPQPSAVYENSEKCSQGEPAAGAEGRPSQVEYR